MTMLVRVESRGAAADVVEVVQVVVGCGQIRLSWWLERLFSGLAMLLPCSVLAAASVLSAHWQWQAQGQAEPVLNSPQHPTLKTLIL